MVKLCFRIFSRSPTLSLAHPPQKASKTHPFVPSANYMGKACDKIIKWLEILESLGDSDEVIACGEDFVNGCGETCCKAFNHACTSAQQQVCKEVMVLLK